MRKRVCCSGSPPEPGLASLRRFALSLHGSGSQTSDVVRCDQARVRHRRAAERGARVPLPADIRAPIGAPFGSRGHA